MEDIQFFSLNVLEDYGVVQLLYGYNEEVFSLNRYCCFPKQLNETIIKKINI
jgi:hypothetical protein